MGVGKGLVICFTKQTVLHRFCLITITSCVYSNHLLMIITTLNLQPCCIISCSIHTTELVYSVVGSVPHNTYACGSIWIFSVQAQIIQNANDRFVV